MTEADEAQRLYKSMYSITIDKSDAKDCAIFTAKELAEQSSYLGHEEFWNGVINEIKKI